MLYQDTFSHYSLLEDIAVQDEKTLIEDMLKKLSSIQVERSSIAQQAETWIKTVRSMPLSTFNIQQFLQAFPLTCPEGRSLMALSEAFLRIPDSYTANLLLKDKIATHKWRTRMKTSGLMLEFSKTGLDFFTFLENKAWGKITRPLSLKVFKFFMSILAEEFILGQTIGTAYKRRLKTPQDRFSFDMLGEGARTFSAAKTYLSSYRHAIEILAKRADKTKSPFERDSLSVKLSALHPHYTFAHRAQIMDELLPQVIELCILARNAGLALTFDAEEAARLELSLDLSEAIAHTDELKGWDGFGLVVQAYQKKAPGVIAWAKNLARTTSRPLMIRLVKGAYWDTEIKIAQVEGYSHYPVFTRKAATDLSYMVCAQQLLKAEGLLYPQFATHNAYTIATLLEMTKGRQDIEFQRLQGMGEQLYKVVRENHQISCRVYAPVGVNQELLPYLVRRLLENGANSSFIHKIYDASINPEDVASDPLAFFELHTPSPHPQIPLPKDLYGKEHLNSQGYDLSDRTTVATLKEGLDSVTFSEDVKNSTLEDVEKGFQTGAAHWQAWDLTPAQKRADILMKAGDLLEDRKYLFLTLLIKEGKKTLPDAIAELREAVDFCRYYAVESLKHFGSPRILSGPTGERNELSLRGRGIFICISPWNFPLAIFMGQVVAALAAGNAVIAKPASQTPLIAKYAVQVLLDAGIPQEILHFLPGQGAVLGTTLVADARTSGIVFTGSTVTAQSIQKTLIETHSSIKPFIAETGGLNAMIVDSSALIEQVVDNVIASAFQSAGQRCSCLRILFIQKDIYPQTVQMLKEAMEALEVGDPEWLSTDVGPVIDEKARDEIEAYIAALMPLSRTPLPNLKGTFVAPTLIEVKGMEDVKREIFGPVLHVASFKAQELDSVIHSINQNGYGLTMGLQTRIESTIQKVRDISHVGNFYVNRNMIGAVVGVQPFGGEGLSGTGPKAGGPYYLPRFAVERTFSYNITASGGNVVLLNLEE